VTIINQVYNIAAEAVACDTDAAQAWEALRRIAELTEFEAHGYLTDAVLAYFAALDTPAHLRNGSVEACEAHRVTMARLVGVAYPPADAG
jgi:hypothetical protein